MHTRVAAIFIVLAASTLGQNHPDTQPKAPKDNTSRPSTSQTTLSQVPTQIRARQLPNGNIESQMPGHDAVPCAPANSPSLEPKESFSSTGTIPIRQRPGSIRRATGLERPDTWDRAKETRELENRFLEKTGIEKRDFLRVVKPESADQQLEALTEIVNAGRLKTKAAVDLLRAFTKRTERSPWSQIERLSVWKYNLTIALTIALFVSGIVSLFTTPTQKLHLHIASVRVEMVVLILPMTFIGLLLIIIVCSTAQEKTLRSLLNSMADKV